MNIIYAGTPDFAVPALQALQQSKHQVVAVYTQPDRPAGRGRKLSPSAVKKVAIDFDLPVLQPLSLKLEEAHQQLADFDADVMVVAAYGLILPVEVLNAPRFGCLNIHASLLPRWRGAAPIQRAIEAGDAESGVTIMQMARGLDTGDMLLKKTSPITDDDTGSSLHDRLSVIGAEALMECLQLLSEQKLVPEKQDETKVCYAHKLSKAEAVIDWQQSAVDIVRKVRAFNAWPVAQTTVGDGVLRVWEARADKQSGGEVPGKVLSESRDNGIQVASGDGSVWLTKIQPAGKKPMLARDFLNGRSLLGMQCT